MQSRLLGYFETLLYFGHIRSISQMTLTMQLFGPLDQEMFRLAFYNLYQKHPLLRSTIHLRDGLLYYDIGNDFTTIPIDFYTEEDEPVYKDIFIQQSQQQLPLDQRNWSVAIIQSTKQNAEPCFDLIWHISHVVADGLSYINLLNELIANLDAQIRKKSIAVKSLPLYDKVEAYLPQQINLTEYFTRQQAISTGVNSIELSPLPESEQSTLSHFTREITSKDLKYLREKAQAEDVTLNNVINASLALAYCDVIGKKQSVTIGSAINLRNKCNPKIPMNICGNYFSAITIMLDENDIGLSQWELAKCYKAKLGKTVKKGFFLPTQYDNHKMHEAVKDFMLPKSDKRQENLGSSYMGEIQFQSHHIIIEKFAIHRKRADGNNLVTTIFNNKMYLTFCFAPEYRTKNWASLLADRVIKYCQ